MTTKRSIKVKAWAFWAAWSLVGGEAIMQGPQRAPRRTLSSRAAPGAAVSVTLCVMHNKGFHQGKSVGI